jgi:hypothetical protein
MQKAPQLIQLRGFSMYGGEGEIRTRFFAFRSFAKTINSVFRAPLTGSLHGNSAQSFRHFIDTP